MDILKQQLMQLACEGWNQASCQCYQAKLLCDLKHCFSTEELFH